LSTLKRKAIVGFGWQAGGLMAQQGIQFFVALLFARQLLKAENGVIAAAMAVLDYAALLRLAGLPQAFVGYEGDDTEARHTVFWVSLGSGALFSAVLFFGAPWLGEVMRSDSLASVLRVLSVVPIVDSLRIVPFTLVWRHLKFKQRAIAELSAFVVGGIAAVVSVILLPEGQKIWAAVIMYLVRYTTQTLAFLIIEPYRPRMRFDREFLRLISRRSMTILGSNLPSGLVDPLLSLFVFGKAREVAGGVLRIASNISGPVEKMSYAANATLYPILAQMREDTDRFKATVLRSIRGAGTLSTGLLAFMLVASPELIPLLLTKKWLDAVPVAQWLCVAAVLRLYTYIATDAMLAANRAKLGLLTWGSTLIFGLALMVFVPMKEGDAVVGARIAASFTGFAACISGTILVTSFKIPAGAIVRALFPALAASAAAALTAFAVGTLLPGAPSIVVLLAKALAYGMVFLPIAGLLLGGGPMSLFTPRGARELIRKN
jgi:O-antigen/teichoic acid export membrane protein